MGHFLASLAWVPLGDVLVNDVQAVNISGSDCLTASIRVTGVDGMSVVCGWGRGGGSVEITGYVWQVSFEVSMQYTVHV